MAEKSFLGDFPNPTVEQWRELVEKQLKGAPFEKKLVTVTAEKISLRPIYLREDGKKFDKTLPTPGNFPFTRGVNAAGTRVHQSKVGQEFSYATPQENNPAISHDSKRGLQTIHLRLDEAGLEGLDPVNASVRQVGKAGISIVTKKDLEDLFAGVDLNSLSFQIRSGKGSSSFLGLFIAYLKSLSFDLTKLSGSLIFDPIGFFVSRGKTDRSVDFLLTEMAGLVSWSRINTPGFRVIGIESRVYSDSGASAVQELAYVFATAVTYIRGLIDKGIEINDVASSISFTLSTGADFFMEIAKFRAARSIWAHIIDAFGGDEEAQKLIFSVGTTAWNKSLYDPYVNMLRATTESLSAVIGGCDGLFVSPFDTVAGLPDEFSRRIARNSQIVIQEESHVDKVIDPAGGSWFIENLTEELAAKTWETFQNVEKQGGMLEALKSGEVQSSIKEISKSKKKAVAQRERVIVGTNMFANLDEELLVSRHPDLERVREERCQQIQEQNEKRNSDDVSNLLSQMKQAGPKERFELSIEAANQGATIGELFAIFNHGEDNVLKIEPLVAERLSDDYEELRKAASAFKNEKGELPRVFLANMGPLLQHKARTDFVIDFLKPGGFEVLSSEGFDSVEAASRAILDSGLQVAVICSSDSTYPELVPEITKRVRAVNPDILIAIAGYPREHIESFKEAGVDQFIHMKANNLELLKQFQIKAGVTR